MDSYLTLIESHRAYMTQEIETIKKELQTLPKGTLVARGTFLYHRVDHKDWGITRNVNLQKQLARAAFLQEKLHRLEANLQTSNIQKYRSLNADSILNDLGKAFKTLPKSFFFHPHIQPWIDASYNTNPIFPEHLRYKTNSGLWVRSKSERMIADTLDELAIPYRYEAELIINDKKYYPDFTILHPFRNKIFYWEHIGMTTSEGYLHKLKSKLSDYLDAQILPGKNLICTYESDVEDAYIIYHTAARILGM